MDVSSADADGGKNDPEEGDDVEVLQRMYEIQIR